MRKPVSSDSSPLQSKWFKVKHFWIVFAILKLPQIALTIELRRDKLRYEFAICLLFLAVVIQWDRAIDFKNSTEV